MTGNRNARGCEPESGFLQNAPVCRCAIHFSQRYTAGGAYGQYRPTDSLLGGIRNLRTGDSTRGVGEGEIRALRIRLDAAGNRGSARGEQDEEP